jgi:hypothetical protein
VHWRRSSWSSLTHLPSLDMVASRLPWRRPRFMVKWRLEFLVVLGLSVGMQGRMSFARMTGWNRVCFHMQPFLGHWQVPLGCMWSKRFCFMLVHHCYAPFPWRSLVMWQSYWIQLQIGPVYKCMSDMVVNCSILCFWHCADVRCICFSILIKNVNRVSL